MRFSKSNNAFIFFFRLFRFLYMRMMLITEILSLNTQKFSHLHALNLVLKLKKTY